MIKIFNLKTTRLKDISVFLTNFFPVEITKRKQEQTMLGSCLKADVPSYTHSHLIMMMMIMTKSKKYFKKQFHCYLGKMIRTYLLTHSIIIIVNYNIAMKIVEKNFLFKSKVKWLFDFNHYKLNPQENIQHNHLSKSMHSICFQSIRFRCFIFLLNYETYPPCCWMMMLPVACVSIYYCYSLIEQKMMRPI